MLKDITLGQYLPGNSAVHRLDPRTKIFLVLAFIITLFAVNSFICYALLGFFLFAVIKAASIPFKMVLKSIKPLLFFLIFTAVINLFMTNGEHVLFQWRFITITAEGIVITVKMAFRLIFLVAGTSVLTYTTSPITLTDGIESLLKPLSAIKVPAHEIAMMMTIALRFIPVIIDETDKIMKAQSARGSDFETGSLMQRARALVPVLVPLFISAFKRAEDLAVAMECRCYRGGSGRTKMKELKMSGLDYRSFVLCGAVFAAVIILGMFAERFGL